MYILIRGTNDVGSAIAHLLFLEGHAVILHEQPQPTATRRKMSFTDAVFDGQAILEGVVAQRMDDETLLAGILSAHALIPILVTDIFSILKNLRPQVLVDARMRKHHQPEPQRGLAPLTIGLGPNFIAGETVDVAVETSWDALGRIVRRGQTNPLSGEPREISGHARDRYVYAPMAGIFCTSCQIGEVVEAGQEVARIDSTPLFAPITGTLRGLTRNNIPVAVKTKVIEVDPRLNGAQCYGIGERPAQIALGVLEIINSEKNKFTERCKNGTDND